MAAKDKKIYIEILIPTGTHARAFDLFGTFWHHELHLPNYWK